MQEWLTREGIPFIVNPDDDLRVGWEQVEARIEGRPIPSLPKGKPAGLLRWEAERAAEKREQEEFDRAHEEATRIWREANKEVFAERDRAERVARSAKRRAAELRRTPPWADHDAIREVYEQARAITRETGIVHHVDHVLPLQGRKVSGLHVHTNLQVLPGSENCRKKNHFEPC